MRRSSKEGPCQEETGWPLGKMIVVVVVVVVVESYYFFNIYYCWRPSTTSPPSRLRAVTLSNKSIYKIQAEPVGSRLCFLLLLLPLSSSSMLLLNLINSLINIIVAPGGPRTPLLACAPLHFPTKVSTKSKQNAYVADGVFCCCCVFFVSLV